MAVLLEKTVMEPRARSGTASGRSVRSFLTEIRAFDGFGRKTVEGLEDGIRYFENAFWTSAQRQAHSLHEISYRACFKPQLPEFFVARLTEPGARVLDPFMGRGTTPLQAALMGREALGGDVSPLSTLLVRPRLRGADLAEVSEALAGVRWDRGEILREDLLAFYHPKTLRALEALRAWLADRGDGADRAADWIRMVALSRLSGHSSGFFSGRTMPPNQAVSVEAQERINRRLGQRPPERDVAGIVLRKSRALLRDGAPPPGPHALWSGLAWQMPQVADASVDLVVTSPPFLDVVDYVGDNWLRCWFAGVDPSAAAVAWIRGEDAWTAMVRRVLAEMERVVRPGGWIAFEVGEVRGGRVLLERLVWKAAEGLAFDRAGVLVNRQDFTKTANCWGVSNGARGTNSNRIVMLRRI
jgi:hypothetical protein